MLHINIRGNPLQNNMASPVKERMLFLLAILCKLGIVCGRGGGGGRGRGSNRVSSRGDTGMSGSNQRQITPEIVMYILVIIAFFILFLCFCLFKEPEEKDYFSAHEKEELKKSTDSDEIVDHQIIENSIVDNPV